MCRNIVAYAVALRSASLGRLVQAIGLNEEPLAISAASNHALAIWRKGCRARGGSWRPLPNLKPSSCGPLHERRHFYPHRRSLRGRNCSLE
jgi:hypothetical protein